MYSESGLIFPYFPCFSPDVQQFHDFSCPPNSNACLGTVVQSSNMLVYDLGGEGDLFNTPGPIIEQPLVTLNSMSMITCGEQELSVTDIRSLQNEEFLSNVFQEYKEILEKEAETESSPFSEVLNYKFPVNTDESSTVRENVHPPGQIPKSISSDCLSLIDWIQGVQIKPSFLNISEVDFRNVYGMRRTFSDGDIKTLANGNGSHRHSSLGQPQLVSDHIIEDRRQKLSRYRNKKTKRKFGRKITYACRKALADSQPRIRGRFAKTEESETWRK
ncbi:hypothetical protein L1987_15349 [Smallanthus sonchifolius]|uniref:Uncharacterized protein n=1 Tax=Smallanthus sonchifolius TaxID=185202 RepID=A0ACB9J5U7_9ASTR|nr:hypothetical protein L1987_15349 [Smallanthus sonchifolius]